MGFFRQPGELRRSSLSTKKKEKKSSIEQYRPISLTSVLGKVVEKAVGFQFGRWLESVLPNCMFGSRPGRGTADAIIQITDRIKGHLANGMKCMVVAKDATAGFDLLPRSLIIRSLEVLGAGPKFVNWTKAYLEDRQSFVQLGETTSDAWTVDTGVIQGGSNSAQFFNVGFMTQHLWVPEAETTNFVDDGASIVWAETAEECQQKGEETANRLAEWFQYAGLTLNAKKTEVVGFGFKPEPFLVGTQNIIPKSEVKFLGCLICSSLKPDRQVDEVTSRVRSAAARIRLEGRNLGIKERRILYNAWALSQVCTNGACYLPLTNASQLRRLQTALNSAVRAVAGLPRKGNFPLTEVRKGLRLESVEMIRDRVLAMEAWKQNVGYKSVTDGPTTRAQKQLKIPVPDMRGWRGKCIGNLGKRMWNNLPSTIKTASDVKKARVLVKRWTQLNM